VQTALAVAAGLVSLAFALSTGERWVDRRRRHELAWTVALAMFSLAAFALAAGAAFGWTPASFRAFYLLGAIVNVPFLALGTVYLLAPRIADRVAAVVALAAAFSAGVVLTAPLLAPLPEDELVKGSEVFDVLPRVLAAVASGGGALVIFAGAVYSAFRFRRGRMLWSNVLIALGTLTLSASGLLNSVLGEMEAFSVTLLVGISVLFAGFLVGAGGRAQERARLRSLPPTPVGSSSTNVTLVGHL
jgi:hypothetical protein